MMKHLILLMVVFVGFFIFSCKPTLTNKFDKVPKDVVDFLKNNLKDPDSFEYVDSYRMEITGHDLKSWFTILDSGLENKAKSRPYLKIEIDSVFSRSKVYGYEYYLQYRAKNSFNAFDNSTDMFVLTLDNKLIKGPNEKGSVKEKIYMSEIAPILSKY